MGKLNASNGLAVNNDLLPEDDIGEALTDDERLRREDQSQQEGGRVEPGPADEARLPTS